jgi:hypothetical protein
MKTSNAATAPQPSPTPKAGGGCLERLVGAQFTRELQARRGHRETEPKPFASSRGCLPLPRRRVLSALKYRPGIIMLTLSCGHQHTWQGWDCRKAPKTTGCGHCPKQVIKQIWISPHFGVLSRYPSAADKPFPFIRPVVLPPHSAVKRPFEGFFSLRPPGRSP